MAPVFSRVSSSIDVLDGLRAIAITLVVCRHVVNPYAQAAWDTQTPLLPVVGLDLANLMVNGWVGVDLFFVLSGFLVAHHLLKRDGSKLTAHSYGRYIGRRALRILPAYYAVLALVVLGVFPLFAVASENLGLRIAYHLALLQDVLPANINVVFWSLGVEWKFYLLLPFLLAVPNARLRVALLVVLAFTPLAIRFVLAAPLDDVMAYEAFFYALRSPFFTCFEGLVLGVLCALAYRHRDRITDRVRLATLTALFWVLLAAMLALLLPSPLLDLGVDRFAQIGLQSTIALLFAGMMMCLLLGGGPVRLLSLPLFLAPARLSYAAYLVHLPLIPLAMVVSHALLGSMEKTATALLLTLGVTVLLTALASIALHVLVEKPFMALGRRTPGHAPHDAALALAKSPAA